MRPTTVSVQGRRTMRSVVALMAAMVIVGCAEGGAPTAPAVVPDLAGGLAIGVDTATGASLETDKDDYMPGEIVHLNGRGWAPNETVHLYMTEDPDTHGPVEMDVTADGSGNFSLHFYDVQEHDLGSTFTLTGTGSLSRSRVTVVFTDGQPQAVTLTPSALTIPVGGGSASSTILVNMVGNANPCTVTLSVTHAIPGATATITGVNPHTAGGGADFTRGLDITTTAATPANTYAFTVTASRGSNCQGMGSEQSSGSLQVVASNTPPTANANGPYSGNEGSAIAISGTAADGDNDPLTTTWSFATGGTGCTIAAPSALSTTVTCNDNGAHSLQLTANDGKAPPVNSAPKALTILNVAPTATFTAPAAVALGVPFAITLTGPADASSADVTAGFTYAFDCGTGPGAFGPANSTNCTATSLATLTVKGKIRDKDGGETPYEADVTVNNQPPTADAGGPYSGDEGSPIALLGTASDPDGGALQSIAWSTTAPAATCTITNASTLNASVTCNDNGSWTVTLTVTDDEGATVASTPVALVVANVDPTVNGFSGGTIDEGSTYSANGSFTDPGSGDSWTATVNYGDGLGVQNLALSGKNFSLSHVYANNGSFTVTVCVTDDDGGSDCETATVTVNNVRPAVNSFGPATINEGSAIAINGSFTDPGDDSWTATVDYGDGGGVQALTLSGKTFALGHTYPQDGSFTVTVCVKDNDDPTAGCGSTTVTVNNVLPVVTLLGPVAALEGETKAYTYSFTDPGADSWTGVGSCGANGVRSAESFSSATKSGGFSCTWNDNYIGQQVSATVNDDDGAGVASKLVTITNVAPSLGTLAVSATVVAVNAPVTASAPFTDPGTGDTHTGTIDWGDGTTTAATIAFNTSNGTGTASGSRAYTDPGVYKVTLTVTDDDGGSDSESYEFVVVYDPSAGFVTGGGWINSPAGAYKADLALTGKANFGFVSKYLKGATVPTGNTEFQFHAGGLNFKSTSYQWLVVNQGGTNAQFKGNGRINGQGAYTFMLWATDGAPDTFRIQITDDNNGNAVVYDNGTNQALGGGSIVIHTGGKK